MSVEQKKKANENIVLKCYFRGYINNIIFVVLSTIVTRPKRRQPVTLNNKMLLSLKVMHSKNGSRRLRVTLCERFAVILRLRYHITCCLRFHALFLHHSAVCVLLHFDCFAWILRIESVFVFGQCIFVLHFRIVIVIELHGVCCFW